MVRFQNRRNRTRWTSDVFWIMRSAIGTLPGLARTTVGHNTAPDHPVEARKLITRMGGWLPWNYILQHVTSLFTLGNIHGNVFRLFN